MDFNYNDLPFHEHNAVQIGGGNNQSQLFDAFCLPDVAFCKAEL